ncbi:MAG: cytochrome c [Planctomycetes bacterium]|nr:cytochrome c [Planctomycetota bacterium]
MTTRLRLLVGSTALLAGFCFLTSAAAAPPTLPAETYKKVAETDLAQLQEHIATAAKGGQDAKRFGPTAKTLAMMLAMYGEATGDAALRDGAVKVAEAIQAKDFAAAGTAAKALAIKGGGKALAPNGLAGKAKFGLEEVMSPFRGSKVGGLNIEKDLREMIKGTTPADPAAVQVLVARTAVLGEYTASFPNEKASINASNKAKWEKWSKDMIDVSKKLDAEASKGKGGDAKEIAKLLKLLDAKCSDCHNEFRD